MAETMKLNDILSDLQHVGTSGMEKTADEKPTADQNTKTARSELVKVLDEAMGTSKIAGEASKDATPVTDKLVKVASDLANSESEALTKEAHLYGAAVADGFMARISQYEQAAGNVKTASPESTGDVEKDFEKFAEENPELTKQAIELGYYHGKAQIEQMKQAAFQKGFGESSVEIEELSKTAEGREKLAAYAEELKKQDAEVEKTAASEFEKWAQTSEGQEAMPRVKQGYAEAAGEINKMASEVFDRGYNDTIKLIQAM